MRDAEQASSPVSDDTILRVITAFNVGVGKYSKLVRRLLPLYRGYECKEPESGKFTLSFRCDSCQLYCVAVCLSVVRADLRRDNAASRACQDGVAGLHSCLASGSAAAAESMFSNCVQASPNRLCVGPLHCMRFCQVGKAQRHCGRTATAKAICSLTHLMCVCVCACRRLEEAVRWSAAVQQALLGMNWPEALLQWGDCQPIKDPDTGALLWRGLRVRMGMSWGQPSYKKPLNTGTQPVVADQLWCKHRGATSQLCLGFAQALNDTACCDLLPATFLCILCL